MARNTAYAYAGPSADVQRCGFSAAMTGSVLDIPHDFANSSYHLDFWGPTIQCSSANNTVLQTAKDFLQDSKGTWGQVSFASWTFQANHAVAYDNTTSMSFTSLDSYSQDMARIFVATYFDDSIQAIECGLYNASYSVDFSFVNDKLSTIIRALTIEQPVAVLTSLGTYNTPWNPDWMTGDNGTRVSYQSVMDVFGKLFVGQGTFTGGQNSQQIDTSYLLTHVSWTDSNKTQRELEELFQNITLSLFSTPTLS